MARKGVVINDPSVQSMTAMQWFFEYYALRRKEREQNQLLQGLVMAGRKLAVKLLGLDLQSYVEGAPESDDFIPLSLLVGQPEVLRAVMEQAEEEADGYAAGNDDDFDAMSKQLMEASSGMKADDGDMIPIISEPLNLDEDMRRNSYMYTDEYKHMLDTLVSPRSRPEDHDQRPARIKFTDG